MPTPQTNESVGIDYLSLSEQTSIVTYLKNYVTKHSATIAKEIYIIGSFATTDATPYKSDLHVKIITGDKVDSQTKPRIENHIQNDHDDIAPDKINQINPTITPTEPSDNIEKVRIG